jgi:hypothetical protein
MPITHSKTCAKPDGPDSSQILSSDWNADHDGGPTADQQDALDNSPTPLSAANPVASVADAGGAPLIVVSDDEPASPLPGMIWRQSDNFGGLVDHIRNAANDAWLGTLTYYVDSGLDVEQGVSVTNARGLDLHTAFNTQQGYQIITPGVYGYFLRVEQHYIAGTQTAGILVGVGDPATNPAANQVTNIQPYDSAPSSGTWTITDPDGDETTAPLQWNADAATVQTALEGLAYFGAGQVSVTGGPLPSAISIEFTGTLANLDPGWLGLDSSGLTGGTYVPADQVNGKPLGWQAPSGSTFHDVTPDAGRLFIKTGEADTDWAQLAIVP